MERLTLYKRRVLPELTDESEFEPFNQFLRAVALMGHQNNVLLDLVANESFLRTARNPESARQHLRLIDYEMKAAAPSTVDVLYELSKVFTSAFQVVSEGAQVSTARDGDNPVIFFEALEALTIDRTDEVSWVLADESGTFTDNTLKANTAASGADNWTPWATPAVKDAFYVGHKHILWNKLDVEVITPGANIVGVLEFYDGDFRKIAPTAVVNTGSALEVDLTSYLGPTNRAGTDIRVEFNNTGNYANAFSTWDGSKNIVTVGFLGQTSPSTTITDYTVGSDWQIINATDETENLTASGGFTFGVPQDLVQHWIVGTVDNKEAFWLRFRVVSVSTPTAPVLRGIQIDDDKQYVTRLCTQGRTQEDNPLGSSTGLASQRFETSKDFFIDASETVTVDAEDWTRVENFLASRSTDKHYTVELGRNERATIVFGDGVAGTIPTIGVGNISVSYRYGANDDGNVGALTTTIDKTGLTYINKLWNPRAATGWDAAEGSDEASLERVKIEGPATLRAKTVAVSPDDVVLLTRQFVSSGGARPFARAKAVEEGYGLKTVELVVVPNGGSLASVDLLTELDDYFNGDRNSAPIKEKHFVANQEVVSTNYTPKTINIAITVSGDVDDDAITTRLGQVFQPDALRSDGVTFEWDFGGTVPISRIIHEVFKVDEEKTRDVDVTLPAADVTLLPRELPKLGTVTITRV